ncbi:male-specific lethal 3 homolog [Schistocerca cancellata]|uniref:male-specific lethal 3 homolog n=1 Tax=Schistocerca cancellata TaxID=274614 RepID=UPI002119729E|nr:male-specific lethal 3 homolog [Schistocerca cancellata]
MVSTRSLRSKFAVGEEVLCYEPDPTKARVLYDSKVLKVLVKTDKGGRKTVEYLIHFQGWNSSWDRYVSEDYVLKHTDENWRLQRKLAEKAHLRPGAYLYRRDRKDQRLNKAPQKTDSYTEEKECLQSTSASASTRDGSISCYSTRSVEPVSNGDRKKRVTADKCETSKQSVMEDKQSHYAHNECDTHAECVEEMHNNKDNGVTGSVDGRDSVEGGRSKDQQYEDFGAQNNLGDREVDDNVQDNKHEITEDFDHPEDGAVEHLEDCNFTCEITDVMKEILELDNELIKNRNKIVHLPARPNVVTILESYVREYAENQISGAREKSRRKYRRPQKQQNGALDMDRLNRSVNICKEVADGVRVYFDFMLSGLLLYNEEREQYEQSRDMTITKEPKSRLNDPSPNKKEANKRFQQPDCILSCEQRTYQEDAVTFDGRMGTPSVKIYSRSQHVVNAEGKGCTLTNASDAASSEETESPNPMGTQSTNKESFVPSDPCKEEASSAFHDNLSSITSVSSKHSSRRLMSNISSAEGMTQGDSHSALKCLLPHLSEWQLVPDSLYTEKPVMPSLIYGAVHLARLLVILPSHLLNTNIPAKKHKIVLQHLQMILRYLEKNRDWFEENVYEDNCSPLKQND